MKEDQIMLEKTPKKQKTKQPPAAAIPVPKKVTITPVKWEVATILIKGTAPYIQNRFAAYKMGEMVEKQKQGSSQAKTRRGKPPKDFERLYQGSMHISQENWHG